MNQDVKILGIKNWKNAVLNTDKWAQFLKKAKAQPKAVMMMMMMMMKIMMSGGKNANAL
jgi:hypothetical protein